MKNELKLKLEEVAKELNTTLDNIIEECYRAKRKEYIEEDIIWYLEEHEDGNCSSDEDIECIFENFEQDEDSDISYWDNIKFAYEKYFSGLQIREAEEEESREEEAKREYYNNVIAPQIDGINRR